MRDFFEQDRWWSLPGAWGISLAAMCGTLRNLTGFLSLVITGLWIARVGGIPASSVGSLWLTALGAHALRVALLHHAAREIDRAGATWD